jgi:3-isopropylmalate/(R)-2-methylmalate dehydratase small subunit
MSEGRAWVFGDDIDTDVLAPGIYMKGSLDDMAAHCLEAVDPDFARQVATGDIVVAGENFGMGSSREQAAQALRQLGVAAVVARSFGGIFYRNTFNNGLLALVCADAGRIQSGACLVVDGAAGRIENKDTGETLHCEPVPDHLMQMIDAGGLVPLLERQLAHEPEAQSK